MKNPPSIMGSMNGIKKMIPKSNAVICLLIFFKISFAAYNNELKDFVECKPLDAQLVLGSAIKSESYNKAAQPAAPLNIEATFVIHEILQVNEIDQTVQLMLTMYQHWNDARLELNLPQCLDNLTIPVPSDLYTAIWIPSTRVTNALSATTTDAPATVRTITSTPKGDVRFRQNIILTLPCNAEYSTFPFDTITCSMVVGTWLPSNYINLTWIDGHPVRVLTNRINLASYAVGKYTFTDISTPTVGGRWVVRYPLNRYFNYYILNVYIPNGLVVVLAWASFWFVPDGGRGGLCLTCLVSIILQFNGVANSIPKVGYTKGIDLWFLGCLVLICITFLEFSFLAFMQNIAGGLDEPMPLKRFKDKYTIRDFSRTIDRWFRFLFIALFVGLVTAYFWIYGKASPTNVGQEDGDH